MKSSTFAAGPLLISFVFAHGVILSAKGPSSKVESVGMQVVLDLARNCTDISPCQQDTAIIRDEEIKANIVNACGRTELAGNIDIGDNTETQLAAGQVANVQAGDMVNVTIHQVNADGGGPYSCDLDTTSNTGTFEFTDLPVSNNVPGANGFSQAKEQDFNVMVKLPDNMNCTGSSAGNVCTLRCRNNALAGPFGGCVALQQTNGGGRTSSAAKDVATKASIDAVASQVEADKKQLNAAVKANQNSGSNSADQGVKAVNALLAAAGLNTAVSGPTSKAAPVAEASATAVPQSNPNPNASSNSNSGANANSNPNANSNSNNNRNNRGGRNRFNQREKMRRTFRSRV